MSILYKGKVVKATLLGACRRPSAVSDAQWPADEEEEDDQQPFTKILPWPAQEFSVTTSSPLHLSIPTNSLIL